MADWEGIRRAMLAMLDTNRRKFADSKIAAQTIKDLRNPKKDFKPTVDKIEQWISICDVTLGQFFSQFEQRFDHPYIPAYDDIYESIAAILRSGDPERIGALRLNLKFLVPEVKRPSDKSVGSRRA